MRYPRNAAFVSSAEATAARRLERRRVSLSAIEEPLLYGAAGASYIAIGIFVTQFLFSWFVAFGWLLLWVWILPATVRRIRR